MNGQPGAYGIGFADQVSQERLWRETFSIPALLSTAIRKLRTGRRLFGPLRSGSRVQDRLRSRNEETRLGMNRAGPRCCVEARAIRTTF